ncbi:unannotated protein [freshwater metagenome]|uniref:Unannotated protein n=1 Tax=freshwater metagenome TaxID=449393 RepID=A0A6J7KQV1_9ZZZZ
MPERSSPSTATSVPAMYCSTRRRPPPDIFCARVAAASALAASSARITPWLADKPTGFTTQGKPPILSISPTTSPGSSNAAYRGWGISKIPRASRIDSLSRVRATASGLLHGKPRRCAAIAATRIPRSSRATIASIPRRSSRSIITDAAAAGSSRGTTIERVPVASGITGSASDAMTISAPIALAAATKSAAR